MGKLAVIKRSGFRKQITQNNWFTGQGLRETAITIFTQHPPKDNPAVGTEPSDLTKVLELAISFDIRVSDSSLPGNCIPFEINVIWSADSTFVRCGDNDTQVRHLPTGAFLLSGAEDAGREDWRSVCHSEE